MSEAKVRWGVTILAGDDGIRTRAMNGDREPFSTGERPLALTFAGGFNDPYKARIVKLTRRATAWRPANEPPKGKTWIQAATKTDQHVARYVDGGWWTAYGEKVEAVTHWRDLPKGPA